MVRASYIVTLSLKILFSMKKVPISLFLKSQLGYLRITDLGIARVWNPDNAKDTSGTPGYMGNYSIINLSSS